MWGTIVDRDGIVCAVAFTGVNRGAQWPGSRVISAQKANTANAFSLDSSSNSGGSGQPHGLALSTANLYSAVQPGGSLFGLQASNPVDTGVAYGGPSSQYGTSHRSHGGAEDRRRERVRRRLGAVRTGQSRSSGGVGVSGDTSCADHNIAWRVRNNLGLDHLSGVGGVSGDAARPDNIIFDITANPMAAREQRRWIRSSDVPEHVRIQHSSRGAAVISSGEPSGCGRSALPRGVDQ